MFIKASEAQITRAMLRKHWKKFDEYVQSDVIIVGAGPAGMVAGYELAKNGVKTMIIERNNYLGGGMWLGGYGVPEMIIRKPGHFILDELGIPYEEDEFGLITVSAPLVSARIIAAAMEAGVFVSNLTSFHDVVLRDAAVQGVVINWSPVDALPRQITCVDPVALESRVVIAATGHDDASVVKRLAEIGLIKKVPGMGAMNVALSEDEIVKYTKEIYPGLIVAGMEVASAFGLHRMGPTFGAMFVSGKRAAEVAMKKLGVKSVEEKLVKMVGERG
ncbi:thiazole biosynthesis protein [Candidatus Peregrinibacteria bacterium]|nr:thiazole biosynthesis protein [Candidatus Peregrinibacteria bacterium]